MGIALGLFSCSGAFLEPKGAAVANADDRLTLQGRICTDDADRNGFPVKVLFIVDQSGSMCVSDPPGSQGGSGFCEQVAQQVTPPGVTQPARVRALQGLLAQFRNQPNVQVSVAPFETNVRNVWPPVVTGNRFQRPDGALDNYVRNLQSQLGKGTDYQGALSYAYTVISDDIQRVAIQRPAELPRTRYVVVFLTDGTPYPRCSANDQLPVYADPDHPELTWEDSSSAVDFCNAIDGVIDGFTVGTDRNQNYQLFTYVDRLMDLKTQFNVGDIRMHSVLLFNEAAVQACGPICQDIYGTYDNVQPAQYPAAAKRIATWTLQQLSQRGNGIYQEFLNGEIQNLGLGALDYTSLFSPNVMKTMTVQSLMSTASGGQRVVDTDGDGLPDTVDNAFTHKSSPYQVDSDGDCFDDNFEVARASQGFFPNQTDTTRGCNPNVAGSNADNDGDGLPDKVEEYLKSHVGIEDSDGDGIVDGLEARYGFDVNSPISVGLDTDGDGVPDLEEFKAGTNPIERDRALYDRDGYQFQAQASPPTDAGSVCYDFTLSNLKLLNTPPHEGVGEGWNLFKVWFSETPASGIATDYGVWKVACAWARYIPPDFRRPVGPELVLGQDNFAPPIDLVSLDQYRRDCVGEGPP
jgi:hypothetical protein